MISTISTLSVFSNSPLVLLASSTCSLIPSSTWYEPNIALSSWTQFFHTPDYPVKWKDEKTNRPPHTWREQTCRSSLSKTVIVIAPALAPHINSSFDFKSATVIDLSILFSLVNEVMLEVMNTVTTSPVTTLKVSLPRA